MVGTPDIFGQNASYEAETAHNYDKEANKEYAKALSEGKLDETTLLADMYYKKIYEDPSVTRSSFSFLHTDHYDGTNFNDVTDTYVNMNTSFRYIRFNIDGAGDTYNKLATNLDYKKDAPQKVFDAIIQKLKSLGYDKIYKNGVWETNTFSSDIDFMYAIGLFQALVEKSNAGASNLSKKDFRVGPKTLNSLLGTTTPLAISVSTEPGKQSTVLTGTGVKTGTEKPGNDVKTSSEDKSADVSDQTQKNVVQEDGSAVADDQQGEVSDATQGEEQPEIVEKTQFDLLLENDDIILSRQNFANWHDIITTSIVDGFKGQEKYFEGSVWIPFLLLFKDRIAITHPEFNGLFTITEDGRLELSKKITVQEKGDIAKLLSAYFMETKKNYSPEGLSYIYYKLDTVWNKDTGYDLPYQSDLIGGLDYSQYGGLLLLFTAIPAKELGITQEQKDLIKTPADIFAFYNRHVQRYNNRSSDYKEKSDKKSSGRNQFKQSITGKLN